MFPSPAFFVTRSFCSPTKTQVSLQLKTNQAITTICSTKNKFSVLRQSSLKSIKPFFHHRNSTTFCFRNQEQPEVLPHSRHL